MRGFEPPAPASRTQCSTRLSYTPAKAAHIALGPVCGKAAALHSPVRPATAFTGQIDGGGGLLDLAIGNGNAGTLARISAIGITNCWLTAESYLEAPGHLPTA